MRIQKLHLKIRGDIMKNVTELLNQIEERTNIIVAKLEILRFAEEDVQTIKKSLEVIKKKLESGEISKFSYATMLEINKKRAMENTNSKKKTWDEVAESINEISDLLNDLKDTFNAKTEFEGIDEIKTSKS
jgi:cell division septum initiation protein DivIVA